VARKRKERAATSGKPVKAAPAGADNARGALVGEFELTQIRRLIRLVQRTGIGELEVNSGDRSVRISAASGSAPGSWVMSAPAPAPARPATTDAPAAPAAADSAAGASRTAQAISSPMVGTFYRAPAPDADPFVEVGDIVEVGQTVCIIEAMKLMNAIEAEVKGRVVQVLVENAQPVEFGQKLFLVEPV
jgi:acetyl-CoA carboxylase biotin carboxyl carrier protein